ncbi:MAG: hypothetical protein JOZ71_07210 [Ktedonobacteraceae bacterium]|nr:hypothetical protein [Ktedonobacteraceae bacterium]
MAIALMTLVRTFPFSRKTASAVAESAAIKDGSGVGMDVAHTNTTSTKTLGA